MDAGDSIKIFAMSTTLAERELDKVEAKLKIDLSRAQESDKDEEYYPQVAHALRMEAAQMAKHYELFYCLEVSIRTLIAETLAAAHTELWWSKCVPPVIQENARRNMQREIDSGVTLRS